MTQDEFNFLSVGDIIQVCPPERVQIYAIVTDMRTNYLEPTDEDVKWWPHLGPSAPAYHLPMVTRRRIMNHEAWGRVCTLSAAANLSNVLDTYIFSNHHYEFRITQAIRYMDGMILAPWSKCYYHLDLGIGVSRPKVAISYRNLNIHDFKINYKVIGDKYV